MPAATPARRTKDRSRQRSAAKRPRTKQPTPTSPAEKEIPVQTKLTVGGVGDRFEREADRVAHEAMRGEGPASVPPTISRLDAQRAPLTSAPKRRESGREGVARPPPARRAPASSLPRVDKDRGPHHHAQRDATGEAAAHAAPRAVEDSIGRLQNAGGHPLGAGTRGFLESRLGHDFSAVRVHHDGEAAAAADSLSSRAFTVGNDVFFNAGEYRPHTSPGRELLAHELTHTVQQGAGRTRAQRTPTPGTGTTPTQQSGEVPADDATAVPTSTTFTSTKLAGAGLDTAKPTGADTRGTITLPVLPLPPIAGGLKGAAGGVMTPVAAPGRAVPAAGAPFTLQPVTARDSTKAYEVWTAYARTHAESGMRAALGQMQKAAPNAAEFHGAGGEATVYYLRFKRSAGHVFYGTLDELAGQDALLRPQWGRTGSPTEGRDGLDADHYLELQIGGDPGGANMWLLDGTYNQAVGNLLKTKIDAGLKTILGEVADEPTIPETEKPTAVTEMKRRWTLRFATVAAGNGYPRAPRNYWTPAEIAAGTHLDKLRFMTDHDLVALGLSPDADGVQPKRIRIFPGPGGGRMRDVRLGKGGEVRGGAFLYRNIWVTGGTYYGGAADQAETRLLSLDVVINKTARGESNPIAEKRGTVDVLRVPELGIAGYLSRESLVRQFADMDFTPLSPLTFTDLGVNADGVLVGTGSILTSKSLFPGLQVPLVLYGDRVLLSFPVPTENLSLGPVSVSEAALSLGVGPRGLFLEGYGRFVVNGLGSGSVTAEMDRTGPRLAFAFDLDTDFFTPAQITGSYVLGTDTLTAGATLGVERGKVPGVESGTVTVLFSNDRLDFQGTVNLAAPLDGTVLTVSYTRDQGLRMGADDIPLPFASLPSVQNATLSIAATRTPDGVWSFGGTGQATVAIPGATGTFDLHYLDGRLTMTAAAAVAKGPAVGTLDVTATNAPVDEQGNPVDGPPTGSITLWGRGTVTIAFGGLVHGTAGIELTPDNRVIISGTIALPPVFEVFARRDYTKDLLHLEPPEFPIWGVSVAGVGVGVFAFVDARVSFDAFVGPGVIRDAAITAELDLDHPESATVHGHGEFYVPAYAGLTLDVGGGLRARAAVAYAQGRVGLQGTLGIEADASAALDIDWTPTAGLAVETRFAANVRPKFRLAANASVTVGVDLYFTDVSHTFGPWERTLGEFGPDVELGVEFPIRWSEAAGLDLSLDNIVVHQPTLDARALMSSVFDALAG